MNAWKVILATLVIFGAGMVTGALYFGHGHSEFLSDSSANAAVPTNSATLANQHDNHMINPPGPLMPMLRKDYLKNLDRELQLTPEQHDHIEKIISEGQDQTKTLWDQIAPQIKEECQETRKAIQAELTPSQIATYEALMKRQQRRAEENRRREAAMAATNTLAAPTDTFGTNATPIPTTAPSAP